MSVEREIRAREIVHDIVSGIGDNELMHKYRLTYRGLQSVFKKLAEAKVVAPALLEGRIVPQLSTETTIVTRLPRKDIFVPLPVEDAADHECRGIVTNITERGIGIKGMKAEVDEVKRLVIKPDKFFQLTPFKLQAVCRWVKPSDDVQEILSGFETTAIRHTELQKLRNLIETLDYMYR